MTSSTPISTAPPCPPQHCTGLDQWPAQHQYPQPLLARLNTVLVSINGQLNIMIDRPPRIVLQPRVKAAVANYQRTRVLVAVDRLQINMT